MSAADEVKLESTTWAEGQFLATCRCSCGSLIAVQLVLGSADESARVSGCRCECGLSYSFRVNREDYDA